MASTALSRRAGLAVCLLTAALLWSLSFPCASAHARGVPELDSWAWCNAHAAAGNDGRAQCLRAESACRAALPDLAPAGGCPDRQMDRCLVRLGDAGSWCAVLCCLDPDDKTCRAAQRVTPELLPLLLRAEPLP